MSLPVYRTLDTSPSDQFPAQALHACQVLAHVLQRVPRPESVQLFTADHWSAPWLQIHLYPDPENTQLTAYQQAFGGLVTRSRRDGEAQGVVYSELATEVDRVRIQVWNVNESPLPAHVPEWRPQAGLDGRVPGPARVDSPAPLHSPAFADERDSAQVRGLAALSEPADVAPAHTAPAHTAPSDAVAHGAADVAADAPPADAAPADDSEPVALPQPADAP